MKNLFVVLAAMTVAISVFAQSGFSSLEEQMTGKEFMDAGLNKLSQKELDALNAWIRQHSLATLDTPAATAAVAGASRSAAPIGDRRGFSDGDDEDDSPIRSPIVGEFDGWDGQTVFKLENGMIWVQDDRDKFYLKDIENPIAVIEPGMFNSWHLHVEGYKSECKVKRIQ